MSIELAEKRKKLISKIGKEKLDLLEQQIKEAAKRNDIKTLKEIAKKIENLQKD